eukprot:2704701-Pleurochrysis_carterae.AAC.2
MSRLQAPKRHSAPPGVHSCPTDRRVSQNDGAHRTSRSVTGREEPCSSTARRWRSPTTVHCLGFLSMPMTYSVEGL